jgi:dUTP pyrophosphatase
MKARISRIISGIELPSYQTDESAGFDIATGEDVIAKPGVITLIATGLVIEAPVGYYLQLNPRSSLAVKKGLMLSNGVGTIDRDYSGPTDQIFLQVFNFGKEDVEIKKGERLVNGIFLPVQQVEWDESAGAPRDEDRGGHGSTGGYHA